ncbi:MAG: carboxypeptidase regulatory-like domain-containing protein [Gemmatimonadota bacterium]|nr:carboxypeptidase regulatory-like domain-containing protein [Gemmatimonadota bacterium]
MSKMAKLMCLWAILGSGAVWAQPDGFIEGTITEEAGEALSGANIAVRSLAEDYKAGTTADVDGQFRIAVPAGNYQVEITFVGYKSDLRENVQVRAAEATRLDVVLVERVIFLAQSVVSASRRQEKILDAPASVFVVEGSEIRNNPMLSLADHVKSLPAVDIAKRGLANANVVVRGFNNIFSGSLLTLTRGHGGARPAPYHGSACRCGGGALGLQDFGPVLYGDRVGVHRPGGGEGPSTEAGGDRCRS